MSNTIGILALQGAVAPHLRALSALGVAAQTVKSPGELDGVDALIIPGGESTTMSMLLDSTGLRAPLTQRLQDGMAAFGTCAGMIMLAAEVLDGRSDQRSLSAIDVAARRNAFGRQVDSFEADLEVTGLAGGSFHAVFIRAPIVVRVGDGVEILATVSNEPVLCRNEHVLVSSFHPELTEDRRLHRYFLELMG